MAMLWNPFENMFTVYESVETPEVNIQLPILNEPIDVSNNFSSVREDGTMIAKPNLSRAIVSNTEEYSPVTTPVETTPVENTTVSPTTQPAVSKPVQLTRFTSKNEWATQLANAYRKLGVSENGIKNLIAKNALESGWGRSALGRYNYGNITTGASWKGEYVNGRDHDGKGRLIRNKFRSYNSIDEYAKDEINLLKRLYDFDDSDDIDTFANKLKGKNKGKRHYAEAPDYVARIKSVYKKL